MPKYLHKEHIVNLHEIVFVVLKVFNKAQKMNY